MCEKELALSGHPVVIHSRMHQYTRLEKSQNYVD